MENALLCAGAAFVVLSQQQEEESLFNYMFSMALVQLFQASCDNTLNAVLSWTSVCAIPFVVLPLHSCSSGAVVLPEGFLLNPCVPLAS